MNLKIPAKRIFGDNFDPGKLSSYYSLCQFLYMKIDLFQPTRSYLRWVLHQFSKQWLNPSLVMLQSRAGAGVGRYSTLGLWTKYRLVAQGLSSAEGCSFSQPSCAQDCERFSTVRCDLPSIKAKAKTQTLLNVCLVKFKLPLCDFFFFPLWKMKLQDLSSMTFELSVSKCASFCSLDETEPLPVVPLTEACLMWTWCDPVSGYGSQLSLLCPHQNTNGNVYWINLGGTTNE